MDATALLLAITTHGLSIRQLPLQTVETWSPSVGDSRAGRHLLPGDEVFEETIAGNYPLEMFNQRVAKGYWSANFRWEDGKVYRKYCRRYRTPKNPGFWMCQQVTNTMSSVAWDSKIHNLAPTLAESVALFLKNLSA